MKQEGAIMTSKDIEAELQKEPFIPFRLHLVSGKVIQVPRPEAAWLMQNTVLVFQKPGRTGHKASGYDVIAFRNIERIEQLEGRTRA
jgi:hypothetical protein